MSQTKTNSLVESFSGALIAAPTANLLHWLLLQLFDQHVINENQPYFITTSWIIFFFHAVAWKYIIRRTFEKYGVQLDAIHLVRALRGRLCK